MTGWSYWPPTAKSGRTRKILSRFVQDVRCHAPISKSLIQSEEHSTRKLCQFRHRTLQWVIRFQFWYYFFTDKIKLLMYKFIVVTLWILQILLITLTNVFIIKPPKCIHFTNLFWHETLHVSCQNKFVKWMHLVGFIIKKFVAMHGHMNVKRVTNVCINYLLSF
jgi:hypothetical protein